MAKTRVRVMDVPGKRRKGKLKRRLMFNNRDEDGAMGNECAYWLVREIRRSWRKQRWNRL